MVTEFLNSNFLFNIINMSPIILVILCLVVFSSSFLYFSLKKAAEHVENEEIKEEPIKVEETLVENVEEIPDPEKEKDRLSKIVNPDMNKPFARISSPSSVEAIEYIKIVGDGIATEAIAEKKKRTYKKRKDVDKISG